MAKRNNKTGTSMGGGLVYTRISNKTKKDDIRKNKQAAIKKSRLSKESTFLIQC